MPFAELKTALFWILSGLCAVAQGAIIIAALRTQPPGTNLKPDGVPESSRAREIIWTIIPALALTVLLWATWQIITEPPPTATQQIVL